MDLIDVSNATQVVQAIDSQLSPPIKNAIASTVLSLTEIQRAFDKDGSLSTFLPRHILLLPPRAQGVQAPHDRYLRYFGELAILANKAAESLACSSILAGQGSESDDTGDVALWLGEGDYGQGKEYNVLRVLELSPWLEQGAKVSPGQSSSLAIRFRHLSTSRCPGWSCRLMGSHYRLPCLTAYRVLKSEILWKR